MLSLENGDDRHLIGKKPEISVIIATRNRADLLANALSSVIAQDFSPGAYEIIVADNASSDATPDVVSRLQCSANVALRYIRQERPGLHFARHAGARVAKSEILLYGDDDIVANRDWVTQIASCYEQYPSAVAVGGKVVARWLAIPPAWLSEFGTLENCGALSLLDLGEGTFPINKSQWLVGCNFSIKKSVLYQVGGFNPDGFPAEAIVWRGDGETGLIRKLRMRNLLVLYSSKAIVEHVIGPSRLTERYFYNRYSREGISRSYSKFRAFKESRRRLAFDVVLSFFRYGRHAFLAKTLKPPRRIYHQAMTRYIASSTWHSIRILGSPDLRKYILRASYLD